MKKKSFFVFSAGCIRRALDSIHLQQYFERNGWLNARSISRADLVVIATCGVVKLNEQNSLRAIALAVKKCRKHATIVVTGCLPTINPAAIREIGNFIFMPTGQLDAMDALINATFPFSATESPDSISTNPAITNYLIARSFCRRSKFYKWVFYKFYMSGTFLALSVVGNKILMRIQAFLSGKTPKKLVPYFNIKIADGCASDCAFCATKYATGKTRSRPIDKIVEEFKSGLEKGYKVFQLIAEDTGCYGIDHGSSLAELLASIFVIPGDYQLVIIDCCPQWLVEKYEHLMPVLVANQDRIKELFVPIQSGSNKILRSMKRKYSVESVVTVLKELRQRAPGIAIRTSFLIGFPGEDERDFAETRQCIGNCDFAEVTINRYEDRPLAESSRMDGKVAQSVIEERARILATEMNCKILS